MNFGEMVALIRDDLIDERLTNVQVQNAVNQALKFYRRKTFYFNTVKTNILVAPGIEYYAVSNINLSGATSAIVLSTNTVLEDAPVGTVVGTLSILEGGDPATTVLTKDIYTIENIKFTPDGETQGWHLTPMMNATVENSRSQSNTSSPKFYSYAQMQIRIHPVPVTYGVLGILATYKYQPFVLDTDTNVFLEHADELIRQAAKRYISYNNLHDTGLGDRCAALEAEEFASLQHETRMREPILEMRIPSDLFMLPTASNFYDIAQDR